MLAGCPTLLSPRHRLRSEASAQFQACHFQLQEKLGAMSTQRLDIPCSFARKEAAPRSQPSRPVGISLEKVNEVKTTTCAIRRNVRTPSSISTPSAFWDGKGEVEDAFWEKRKSLKRYSEQSSSEESCANRAKRKRSSSSNTTPDDSSDGERLSVGQLGSASFWYPLAVDDPHSMLGITSLPPPVPFPASSSAEEERFCFVPSEAILPSDPLSNNPWMESIVTEITDKGDKDVVTSEGPKNTKSSSSTSSESHSLSLKLNESSSANETGNGSQNPYLYEGSRAATGNGSTQTGNQGLELVSLLVACVEAIELRNFANINQFLSRLGELASPEGTPIQRVGSYFTEALAIRTARLWPSIFHIAPPRELDRAEDEAATSFRLLNHLSPIPKFLHFTSNEMILRAFEGKDRVHIIDFDIKQGLQWPGLFHSLASRPNPPTHVRITGIGESKQELQDTGDRLAGFAAALNLPFEFHPVVDRLEDVRLWMLHVKENECVAVNCILQLHKVLYDESGGVFRNLLGLIRSTNPTIVLVAEQEAEHNHLKWERRFLDSLKYYSAIFDSLDSSLPLDSSPTKIKVEEMFAREIRNIIACEGSDRVERHENFNTWRRLMEEGGFRCMGVTERESLQSQMLLKMFSSKDYNVEKQGEDGGGLTLSWLDQPLFTVSSWAPIDFAGSSSSLSQPS